jgi:molecular chaperone DnaJ
VRKPNGVEGDLLVTVELALPPSLDEEASAALRTYAESTKSFDPRSDLLGGGR